MMNKVLYIINRTCIQQR